MSEIAKTAFGRNALVAGLICHFAAVLAGMTTASGGALFFKTVYPFSCLLLTAGAFAEMRSAGHTPAAGWRWYAAAIVTVLPAIGPLMNLGILYGMQSGRHLSGLFPAILRLRANLLLISVLLLLLLLFLALVNMRDDPYFKKRARYSTLSISGQISPVGKVK